MAKKELEAKVMAVLGGNNVKIEETKEISSIRIPMCDGTGFMSAKAVHGRIMNLDKEEGKMAKEMLKAWNLEDGVGMVKPGTLAKLNKKAMKMMKKDKPVSIDKAIKLFRHPLCDIDEVHSGYTVKQIMNLLMECNEKISKQNNVVIDLAFNNR